MAIAPAAVPAAIDLAVGLAYVVALIVAFGLLYAWRGIGHPTIVAFAKLFNIVSVPWIRGTKHPFGFIASWLEDADKAIDSSFAQLVFNCEKGIVRLWHAMAAQVTMLGRLLGDLAETIETRWRGFLLAIPPVALLWLAVRAARQLPAVWKAIGRAEHAIAHTTTRVVHDAAKVTNVTKQYVTKKVYEAAPAVVKAVAAAPAWVNGRFRGVEHDLSAIRARLRNLERPAVIAAGAAVVGVALSRLGLGFLRCPRFARAGRQVCGMNAGLLDSLLADTALIVGTVSLVEFAREMQDITGRAAPLVRHFWRAA